MPSLPATRTTRRLLKLASLGLAGLLAGLLSGCTSAGPHTLATYLSSGHSANVEASQNTSDAYDNPYPDTLDSRQIPALRHAPSARRLDYGTVHLSHTALNAQP